MLSIRNRTKNVVSVADPRDSGAWLSRYSLVGGDRGGSIGAEVLDRIREGDKACPPPVGGLVNVAPEGRVDRVGALDLSGLDDAPNEVILHVAVLLYSDAVQCGPAHWLERDVKLSWSRPGS
jgi:hypothetical protein